MINSPPVPFIKNKKIDVANNLNFELCSYIKKFHKKMLISENSK